MRGSAVFRTGIAPGGALAGPWVRNPLWTRARAVPSLDLRFADNKSLVDATTGASLVTFTRASTGTYVGSDGLIKSAVTNLLVQSEDFSTTWANTESTEASNVETAPNGTLTADKLIPDVGVTSGQFRQDVSKAATATTYTCSVYGKAAEFNRLSIRVEHNGSTGNRADVGFSLSDGSVVSAAAALGTFSGASATATSVGAGWYRFTLSFTSSTETSIRVRLFGFDSSLPCNGTSGIYLWGAQLEQSATVGEYIPTTSTINSAPRFDHNPTTGESLGLLVEEARTNLVTWSQDLSNADWTKAASTIVSTAVASPIQGVNYQKIEATSANTTVGVTSIAVTAATQQRAVSFFAQPLGNISRVLVVIQGIDARINVNLVDGTFTTNAIATGSTVSVSGQRFSVSTPTLTLATGVRFFLKRTGETDTTTPTTIAIGEGLYLTGAQMEAGAFATSYIPTTSATVTRAADVASITGTNFSSWYNQTEGTVFASMSALAVAPVTVVQPLYTIHDGSTDNRIALYKRLNADVSTRLDIAVAAVSQAFINAGTFTLNNVSAAAIQINNFAVSLNGLTALSDTSGNVPVVNQIILGQYVNGTAFLNGHIKRLVYWGQRLPNNVLQAITQ